MKNAAWIVLMVFFLLSACSEQRARVVRVDDAAGGDRAAKTADVKSWIGEHQVLSCTAGFEDFNTSKARMLCEFSESPEGHA